MNCIFFAAGTCGPARTPDGLGILKCNRRPGCGFEARLTAADYVEFAIKQSNETIAEPLSARHKEVLHG